MQKQSVVSSIPAFKDANDQWVLQAQGKADLYVDTFLRKFVLSAEMVNEYTPLPTASFRPQRNLKKLRDKDAQGVMEKLRIDSGTGPDMLPARILKFCSAALALPVLLLTNIVDWQMAPTLATTLGRPALQTQERLPARQLPRHTLDSSAL